jgi:two-component system sensor histidine kinase HydH
MTNLPSPPSLRRSFFLQLSPWLMVGLALIFGLAIAVLAARNTQRERLHMSQNLSDRAGSLIWALEAGTRAWMGMRGSQNLQALLDRKSTRLNSSHRLTSRMPSSA